MNWGKRKPRVRLHLSSDEGTPEGLLVGRGRDYKLIDATYLEGENRTHELEGMVKIPSGRVRFYQVLS